MMVSTEIRNNVRDLASCAAIGHMLNDMREAGVSAADVDMLQANRRYREVRDAMAAQFPHYTDVNARNVEPATLGAVRWALDFAQRRDAVAAEYSELLTSGDTQAVVDYARAFESVPLFADEIA